MTLAIGLKEPSPLFMAQRATLANSARLGPIADLACGRGRHVLAAAEMSLPVIGLDRNVGFLSFLGGRARNLGLRVATVRADLECGQAPPIRSGSCGAVLVFRFLFRPLAPAIEDLLAPGGLLLYETFTRAKAEQQAGPSNPDFLLDSGELPDLFPGLETISFAEPKTENVARLVAQKRR